MCELSSPEDENTETHSTHVFSSSLHCHQHRGEKARVLRRAKEPHYSHMGGEKKVKTLVGNEASPVC